MFFQGLKVYIVGNSSKWYYPEVKYQYEDAKKRLEILGCTVFNPIERFYEQKFDNVELTHKNLSDLFSSDAIYILHNNKIDVNNSIELMTATKLGLYFFHEF